MGQGIRGIGALVEGNPGNVKKAEPSVTPGYRLRLMKRGQGTETVRDR